MSQYSVKTELEFSSIWNIVHFLAREQKPIYPKYTENLRIITNTLSVPSVSLNKQNNHDWEEFIFIRASKNAEWNAKGNGHSFLNWDTQNSVNQPVDVEVKKVLENNKCIVL